MMKIIVLIYTLLAFTTTTHAQRFREVLKWQVETMSGGLVFGISESKDEANSILNDFQNRNEDTKYDITGTERIFTYATLPIENKHENPVALFRNIANRGYKVLSSEDLRALNIIERKGFKDGIDYYIRARNADRSFAISRFNNLTEYYSKYVK